MPIFQRRGFVGVEHTGDAPLNGNAEVLLGPSRVSDANGGVSVPPWVCQSGRLAPTPQAIGKSSGPLTLENPVHVENSGFAAALFYQAGNRNLKALHRLAQVPSFSKICECLGLTSFSSF